METDGLSHIFGELSIQNPDSDNNTLLQVIKAVEAAQLTIRQQDEEKNRLWAELLKRDQELESFKLDKRTSHSSAYPSSEYAQGYKRVHQTDHIHDAPGGQTAKNANYSQPSSPILYSPGRFSKDGEYDPNAPVQRPMPITESDNHSNLWNQIREREEEIIQLRKHLKDYTIKEAQIRNEKSILEKRIAHMRMAFDMQQQDLVDGASKALSYRQDIIEENIRLTYALQGVQQERTTFMSSLLPLLAEHSLQPQVLDAQSIVSNIKVLFKHLEEKLSITEENLRVYQYQMAPWRSGNTSPNFGALSPDNSSGAALNSSKNGLELVPRPSYTLENLATSDGIAADRNLRGQHAVQAGASSIIVQNVELDNVERDSDARDVQTHVDVGRDESRATQKRQIKLKEPVSTSDGTATQGNFPYPHTNQDSNFSYSPSLQPVPEEPSSSFSEAADDDPLPGIEGLQIYGEPYPGLQIEARGYSVNGTTSCIFEWVRHFEDGSVKYVDGAKQPGYLVTADDVDTYLAIEVQPLDKRMRKGELVKVFTNELRKITCDPSMQSHIEQNLQNGHASYYVSVATGYFDIWEQATLTIKREGYSIKGSGSSSVSINEKFVPGTKVEITYGNLLDFSICGPSEVMHVLRAKNTIPDIASLRDAIVLTLRLFIIKAMQKGKGKRRKIFFK